MIAKGIVLSPTKNPSGKIPPTKQGTGMALVISFFLVILVCKNTSFD
jgi:hypothetical protein